MPTLAGGQLTGRFAWPSELIEAARKYTREKTETNLSELKEARRAAARAIVSLQAASGFEFLTDGGTGMLDILMPYAGGIEGVSSGGNIDKYPGTRNSYYHTPVVRSELKAEPVVSNYLYTDEIATGKRKAILPSPASLALASENSHYRSLEDLMLAFAGVLREDVSELATLGYELIQLNECFLTVERFSKKVTKEVVRAFADSVEEVFQGFGKRSCVYFHSGDAARFLSPVLDTGITDVGFDFNTAAPDAARAEISRNVILGLQNTTRKIPGEWLEREPELLAARTREFVRSLKLQGDGVVFLAPSQDYDGLQTYPQAKRRLENLAEAIAIMKGDAD